MQACALEAGAAKTAITPELGAPLNGYGDRLGRNSVAVHDPIWARCLFLDDGETFVFLVCADLCWINGELRDRVLELADEAFRRNAPDTLGQGQRGKLRERTILTATHNHSAQGGMIRALPFRFISGRFVPEVLETTAQGIVSAMQEAYANRKRAAVGFGTASCEGLSQNRRIEGGPVDNQLGILRVDDADGNPIALAANFAAHPTTVGGDDMFTISADYPGFFYATLEQLAGGSAIALFFNGTAGNQRCANPEGKAGWERTESVGRLLAIRASKAADTVACGEARLHVGYAAPPVPPSIAKPYFPETTIIQTLEVRLVAAGQTNDVQAPNGPCLLMTFFPGEACVEVGLELRGRARERGYAAQFGVGPANDYLAYFVPAGQYAANSYESEMSFFGPRMENWLYDQFASLMTLGAEVDSSTAASPPASSPPSVDTVAGFQRVVLSGSSYEMGRQRGAVFKDAISETYTRRVVDLVESRRLAPDTGIWSYVPSWIRVTPVALPYLAAQVRHRLAGVTTGVFEELAGMADGAGAPFDAVWMLHCAAPFPLLETDEDAYPLPSGAMVAAVGDRAGAEDLLVGANFDWWGPENPALFVMCPAQGRRYVQIGVGVDAGAVAGMNDAGLVICAVRTAPPEDPAVRAPLLDRMAGKDSEPNSGTEAPPLGLVLHALLQQAQDVDSVLAAIQAIPEFRGHHVLVAAPESKKAVSRVCVLDCGSSTAVRRPVEGFLLGAEPNDAAVSSAAQQRHARAAELLRAERIISAVELAQTLGDRQQDQERSACLFSANTRCSVVFEPKRNRLQIAFPNQDGSPGEFTTVSLSDAAEGKAHD